LVVPPVVSTQVGSVPPLVPAVVQRKTRSFPTVGEATCRHKSPTLYAVDAAHCVTAEYFVLPTYQMAIRYSPAVARSAAS
jgi:hypothetical protein